MTKKIIFICLFTFLLTGCYDYKELNSISITSAVEISKEDNEYQISVQVINAQAPDKSVITQAPFIMYNATGKTIQEAYRNMALNTSRYIYSNHMELLIINEKIAKKDIKEIIDFFLRNPSIRTEFYVIIGKSDNILSTITPIDDVSAISIKNSIDTNIKFQGMTNNVTFNEFTNMIINPHLEVALPSIELVTNHSNDNDKNNKEDNNNNHENNKDDSNEDNKDSKKEDNNGDNIKNTEKTEISNKFKLSGIAVFKNNKLIDYLSKEDSINYNIIKNNVNDFILIHECEKDKYITIEVITSNSKINIKNNEIYIDINMKSNINESTCKIELNKQENIKKIEKYFEQDLKKQLLESINKQRNKYNTDIYGFLDTIYKKDYNLYTKVKDNWYKGTYQNMNVNIDTNISIVGKGNILEAINEKD